MGKIKDKETIELIKKTIELQKKILELEIKALNNKILFRHLDSIQDKQHFTNLSIWVLILTLLLLGVS